eukprot:XP_011672904.1 PREDICTED: 1-phosphatidylinositol 4,5-bisphosphate phosphodiesterase delta-1-like [Strongylocentrotus purpuratus]
MVPTGITAFQLSASRRGKTDTMPVRKLQLHASRNLSSYSKNNYTYATTLPYQTIPLYTAQFRRKVKLAKNIDSTDQLIPLTRPVPLRFLSLASKEKYKCHQMSSFGEAKAFGLAEDKPGDYVEHNKIFLSRIYPGGLRTNSSNYSPVPMWDVGAQIVALNFQTPCEEMDLNQGKFLQNGKSGFILKPVFCRKPNMQFNPLKPGDQYTQHVTLTVGRPSARVCQQIQRTLGSSAAQF